MGTNFVVGEQLRHIQLCAVATTTAGQIEPRIGKLLVFWNTATEFIYVPQIYLCRYISCECRNAVQLRRSVVILFNAEPKKILAIFPSSI